MRKVKVYSMWLALVFACLSPVFAQAASQTVGPYTLTTLDRQEASQTIEGVHHLSLHEGGGKYFLDEADRFLIDFQWMDLNLQGINRVEVHVGGNTFELDRLSPFILDGITKGEVDVKVKLFDAQGASISFLQGHSGKVSIHAIETTPFFKNDAIVFGLLLLVLAIIFKTNAMPQFSKFYKFVPALLLCYFVPSLLNSAGIISGDYSKLYFVASRYLLPASLLLLCLSIDLKGIIRLGPRSIIMFLTATVGIMVGGPVAILLVSWINPDFVAGEGADEIFRGLSTVAGSWIGGGANQAAMKEIYEPSAQLYSKMIFVDIIVANIWMAVLLYGAGVHKKMDRLLKADGSAIEQLKEKLEGYSAKIARIPTLTDLIVIVAIGAAGTAVAHWWSAEIKSWFHAIRPTLEAWNLTSLDSGFFWLVVVATTIGVLLSFTKLRSYEGAGASKIGSLFLYILVATIGMHMDVTEIFKQPSLFLIGIIWMAVHVIILLLVARLIKAPFFFVAVGSQANVGGAASAPIVASAFSPALAPVGVLLAVLGYAAGTYGAIICTLMMQQV